METRCLRTAGRLFMMSSWLVPVGYLYLFLGAAISDTGAGIADYGPDEWIGILLLSTGGACLLAALLFALRALLGALVRIVMARAIEPQPTTKPAA